VKDGLPDTDRGILLQTLCSGDGIVLRRKKLCKAYARYKEGKDTSR